MVRIKLEQAKGNPLTMAQNMATGEALQFAPRQDLPSNDQRDPVATIFQRFQQEGKQAAWQEYSRLRRIGELSKADRQELAAAAEQQGLNDMAAQIRDHIQRDFDQ